MVDRTRTEKAAKRFLVASDMHRSDQPNTPYVKIMGPSVDDVEAVLAAARAVVEAPEVEWCETHSAVVHPPPGVDDLRCDVWVIAIYDGWEPKDSCRMVRKFLVPAEEET
jgi:hypothetical protein